MNVAYEWRGTFVNSDLNRLHAEAFEHQVLDDDWVGQVARHSLGWVCAYLDSELVGFVNVAWDGGVHAFVLDTIVAANLRHRGIGRRLVEEAVSGARSANCEWLHVDFDGHLRDFYLDSCGFVETDAGLIEL